LLRNKKNLNHPIKKGGFLKTKNNPKIKAIKKARF